MKLNKNDYQIIIENSLRRLINEDKELTPFEIYSNDYQGDNYFKNINITKDKLSEWCLNNDFLYIINFMGQWRISAGNSSDIQKEIVSDIQNCAFIEPTHEMDWLIENRFEKIFARNTYVVVFKLHDTPDGDYYVIYER